MRERRKELWKEGEIVREIVGSKRTALSLPTGASRPPAEARSVPAPPAGAPLSSSDAAVAGRAQDRGSTRRALLPRELHSGQDRAGRRSGPTRLETRTKESDMGASVRVANPYAQRNRDEA